MDNNQTPNQTGGDGDDGQVNANANNDHGTGQNGTGEAEDYKAKFAASTAENQRILSEFKSLQDRAEELEASLTETKDSLTVLERQYKEDKPEEYEAAKANKAIGSLQEKVAVIDETNRLNDFIGSTSDAQTHKEALRALGRANPRKSYATLWKENFAAFYEGKDGTKKSQPETGKGAVVADIETGDLPDGFNSWPVEKRKVWFKNHNSMR
jgi:predicted RNase H-like nuclease (RuvC/YqgF family)